MLDPMFSNEHRLEVCDKALADDAVKNKDTFLDYKLHTLSKMFRHDEVEQILLDRAATTKTRRCGSRASKPMPAATASSLLPCPMP